MQLSRLKSDITALYNSTTSTREVEEIIERSYHDNACFEDAIGIVSGKEHVKIQFLAMHKWFAGFAVKESTFSHNPEDDVLLWHAKITYSFSNWLPFQFTTHSACRFQLRNGKVLIHREHWSVESFMDSIPIVRSVYPMYKKGMALFVETLYRNIHTEKKGIEAARAASTLIPSSPAS
jgi:hypothetical protein